MIIDTSPLFDLDAFEFKVEVDLIQEGEKIRHFRFEGPFSEVFTRLLEIDDFAFNYMAYHGVNLEAETKVEPLIDK